ncbi:SAM hydrolase/SAM-dependent halogenase family protein [Pelomicrobium methylotrophicum]|uniref:SAM-dependent chlorinase/fluorinase n=1 Tax=Pelomicrobium methylotrophicum TaxID=2602750 RepID=A0A5C7F0R9_9PROT|nr:SAM-dependent chlorinase/fluorinase [Pelomicrobium methylotrophicum]TXF13084.1 SAM-dependent chlorinase/fluorinase [Pelomicrobium methylotrophicum]
MTIVLFTDFGSSDVYVGQVHAMLAREAPQARVIDLLHDAPAFDIEASAHLLAALAPEFEAGAVFVAVVDPGVGGARSAVAVRADGRWFVGPDNGLLSVIAGRARDTAFFRIDWQPPRLTASFHGRDLFAPVAARIARGDDPATFLRQVPGLEVKLPAGDLARIIYIDHYGNAMTGLRAEGASPDLRLQVAGCDLAHARVFCEVAVGTPFWYENCLGLVEVAVNQGSAAAALGLCVGTPVTWR